MWDEAPRSESYEGKRNGERRAKEVFMSFINCPFVSKT